MVAQMNRENFGIVLQNGHAAPLADHTIESTRRDQFLRAIVADPIAMLLTQKREPAARSAAEAALASPFRLDQFPSQ